MQFNGHHYILVNSDSATWWDANDLCESQGGHLVTINSAREQDFVEKMIAHYGNKNNYWTGGYKDDDDIWCWVTDENFVFTCWAPEEPNNFRNQENFLAIYGDTHPHFGGWNDIRGDGFSRAGDTFFGEKNFGFICEWDY